MLADPMREKIMNALADDETIGAAFDEDTLQAITDIVLNTIIEELSRGVDLAQAK